MARRFRDPRCDSPFRSAQEPLCLAKGADRPGLRPLERRRGASQVLEAVLDAPALRDVAGRDFEEVLDEIDARRARGVDVELSFDTKPPVTSLYAVESQFPRALYTVNAGSRHIYV